jgi:GcrA cell cycle regulator
MTRPRRYAENDAPAARGKRECAWPIGHPGEKDFRFCGAAAQPGRVYCAQHTAIAFTPQSGRTAIGRSTKRK